MAWVSLGVYLFTLQKNRMHSKKTDVEPNFCPVCYLKWLEQLP